MLTLLAAHGGGIGPGFLWVPFVLVPLFWILVIALFAAFARRRWSRGGSGPWAHSGVRSAQATLAQRFANGDIDEQEYRARLEVLRANEPQR
ncbi:MAG TPA: hypothetical protein VN200_07645 [Rhodoglobus sp.]|nr:hypothetical protein [Rhodoglobus sp.]